MSLLAPPPESAMTFGDLVDLQTVGLGMYLALVIIQAVSTGGLATLRRRVQALEAAARANRLRSEFASVRSLYGHISRLEIGIDAFQRRTLRTTTALFTLALGYFAFCVLNAKRTVGSIEVAVVLALYIALPMAIYLGSVFVLLRRSKPARDEIAEVQKRIIGIG